MCIIELAAAKPPPTLRYTPFLKLFGAFTLVYCTMVLISSNSAVHVISASVAESLLIGITVLEKAPAANSKTCISYFLDHLCLLQNSNSDSQ